jgi:hypothetical protein
MGVRPASGPWRPRSPASLRGPEVSQTPGRGFRVPGAFTNITGVPNSAFCIRLGLGGVARGVRCPRTWDRFVLGWRPPGREVRLFFCSGRKRNLT